MMSPRLGVRCLTPPRSYFRALVFGMATLAVVMLVGGCGDPQSVTVTETVTVTGETSNDESTTQGDTGNDTSPIDDSEKAKPTIIPGVSIRGISRGMTQSQLHSILGAADSTSSQTTELGTYTTKKWTDITVILSSASTPQTVSQVETRAEDDVTALGVGPGSSTAVVKAAYPKASCDSGGGTIICRMTGSGGAVTDFILTGGTVQRVVIGVAD